MATSTKLAPAAIPKAAGVTPRGSFHCEARCFCPAGDTVWVGERNGTITIRCARSGSVLHTIEPSSSNHLFASAMYVVLGEMWIGATDGRLCVFNLATYEMTNELLNPETERQGEVNDISHDSYYLYVAMSSCRVCEWDIRTKTFVKSYVHAAPAHACVATNFVLYSADEKGNLCVWDIKSGECIEASRENTIGVCRLLWEPATETLWCSRMDGKVEVYTVGPLALIDTIIDAHGRINSLVHIGGKVWGGGVERCVYIWHAHTRKLLGKIRDHSAFIFSIGKLYSLETSRIWTLSNDKTVNIYDGEGFFTPVKDTSSHHEELSQAHAKCQSLKMELSVMEKKLSVVNDRVAQRDDELIRLREETQQQMLKIHALEHVVQTKEEVIVGSSEDRNKLLEEVNTMSAKVGELTVKLNGVEQEKATLRGDIAKTQEELSRTKGQVTEKTSKFSLAETERTSLQGDKERLQSALEAKERDIIQLNLELQRAKDVIASKQLDVMRKEGESGTLASRLKDFEREKSLLGEQKKALEEANRRLEDTVILREAEMKELLGQLRRANDEKDSTLRNVDELSKSREVQSSENQKVQDTFVLRTHEYELLKSEKSDLEEALRQEKQHLYEAKANENKMRLQNDELRRQLETERNAVKMLEDQYTIFQFVINSRGELIQSIWNLNKKLAVTSKGLRNFEKSVKQIDPNMDKVSLKHAWQKNVVERATTSTDSVNEVTKHVEYIVANYLSEYEKMHLGISLAQYPPDTSRPPVVGDQLLTKLRDVTLMKQYNKTPQDEQLARALPPPTSSYIAPNQSQQTLQLSAVSGTGGSVRPLY